MTFPATKSRRTITNPGNPRVATTIMDAQRSQSRLRLNRSPRNRLDSRNRRYKPPPKSTRPRTEERKAPGSAEEPPRPKPPPKSRRTPTREHTAPNPIEEPPTNHYATLDIFSLASPEEFAYFVLGKSLRH